MLVSSLRAEVEQKEQIAALAISGKQVSEAVITSARSD